MIYILCFVFLAPLPVLNAQSCDIPSGVSELEQAGILYRCGDLDSAQVILEISLNATDDSVERANIQMILGLIYYDREEYLPSQNAFERSFLAYINAGLIEEGGQAYYYAGRTKEARRFYSEALAYYSEGLRHSTSVGDSVTIGLHQNGLGRIYTKQNEYELAHTAFIAALTAYRETGNHLEQANTLRLLGELSIDTGDLVTAESSFLDMVGIAETEGLSDILAYGLLELGALDSFRGATGSAIERLTTALALFEEARDTEGITRTYIRLAELHLDLRDYIQANEYIELVNESTSLETDCPGYLQAITVEAMYDFQRGNYLVAESLFSEVINTADIAEGACTNLNPRIRAAALYGRGLLRIQNRQIVVGGDDLQFALTAYREADDPIGEHRVMLALGELEMSRGRFDQALEYIYTSLDIAVETGSVTGQINTYFILSEVDLRQGYFVAAQEKLELVLSLANEFDNRLAEGRALDAISNLYLVQTRFSDALDFLERAAEIYPNDSGTYDSRILFTRGRIYELTGEYDLAETFYNRAGESFADIGELQNTLEVDLAIAHMIQNLNRMSEAEDLYELILQQARRIGDREIIAQAQLNLGTLQLSAWDRIVANSVSLNIDRQNEIYDDVTGRFVEAYDIFLEADNINGQADTLNRIGLLGMRRTIPANWGTGGFFQEGLRLSRQIGDRLLESEILNNLAGFHEASDQLSTAIRFYNESLQIASDLNPVLAAQIQVKLGRIYERQGNRSTALQIYDAATEQIESIYANFSTGTNVQDFGAEELYLLPYERLIRNYGLNVITNRAQDWATTFAYAEASRARSFLFQFGGQSVEFPNSRSGSILQEWYDLRNEVITLNTRIRELQRSNGDADVSELEEQITFLSEGLNTVESDVEFSALRQLVTIDTVEMETLQASLPEGTAMISYYVLKQTSGVFNEGGRIFIFVISRDSLYMHAQLINQYETDLVARVNTFRNNPLEYAPLAVLYQSVIAPIANQIEDYTDLVIVPHDVLNYIPFEALPDVEGTPLVERYNISYSPSATIYTLMVNNNISSSDEGQPAIFQHGADLFFAEEEAVIVAGILQTEPWLGDDATETLFRQNALVADVIHVAAHGVFDPHNSLESYLQFASDDQNDGRLHVSEIYGLSFDTFKPLVVLSACETAVNTVNPGDEIQGMTRAFLLSGARGVVASLWAVDDVTSSELMSLFYSNRATGMRDSEALAAAKRELSEIYPEPYFWAGFVFVGIDAP